MFRFIKIRPIEVLLLLLLLILKIIIKMVKNLVIKNFKLVSAMQLFCGFFFCLQDCKSCTILDGYYVESIACFLIGIVWLKHWSSKVRRLQELLPADWTTNKPANS